MVEVKITTADEENFDNLPRYESLGAAGADIRAAGAEVISLKPGTFALIPTGLFIEIPNGYEIQIRSRSGLAAKHGIFCLNSPGTIDSDYRGEIRVILANFGQQDFIIAPGDRIAQMVLAKYEQIQWALVDKLTTTDRGNQGFGSTGSQ